MTSPKDLTRTPEKYQVVKLKNGLEIVGMTVDKGDSIDVTLPMHCSLLPSKFQAGHTVCQFYPYIPMTDEPVVSIEKDTIMATVSLAKQYIPMYDQACVRWSTWVETETIPVIDKEPIDRGSLQERISSLMEEMQASGEYDDLLDEEFDDFGVEDLSKKTIH